MNLFKKIFASAKSKPGRPAFVDRAPRVHVSPLHDIGFSSLESGAFEVGNLSTTGLALVLSDANSEALKVGNEIEGLLTIEGQKYLVTIIVRHRDAALVGCQFKVIPLELRRTIELYLRVELLACMLKKVSDNYLKPDERGEPLWFTDGQRNELYCVVDKEGVVAFYLNFFGHYVEGGRARKPRVGTVEDFESDLEQLTASHDEDEPGHKGSSLVEFASGESAETLVLAQSFVQNVSELDAKLREEINRHLSA